MGSLHLIRQLQDIKLTKGYIFLACLYGLSTLLIPFATQLLVNTLALANLWISSFTFLLLIGVALAASLLIKYFQLLLMEYMQRHLFYREVARWQRRTPPSEMNNPYFFELFALMKNFATIVTEGVDLLLKAIFGGLALAFIHPGFLVLGVLFVFSLIVIRWQGRGAIGTSLAESTSKYELFYNLRTHSLKGNAGFVASYLRNRDRHFGSIRRQAVTVYGCFFVLQMILLAWGIHLIQVNQLSIGQLVSAEIIISGIFINFANLPKLIESFYDFETSSIKVESLRKKERA